MTTIELSAPVNLRDLGGTAIEGGVVRPGFAIRTDDLAYVTEEVADGLVANGLTAIIDLRSSVEVATTGRGPLATRPVTYHHLPLIADVGAAMSEDGPDLGHEAMGAMYVRMVEGAASQLVIALNVIAVTPGATAFHCAAGRDRTGVLAAVLLLALGADDEAIVHDYARTGDNMAAILARIQPVMAAMWKALGFEGHDSSTLLKGSMEVSMRTLLATLRDRHGDALAPLYAAGLTGDTIARLRTKALGA
ncbi:tyrosine-protein phosphatase [Microbacterium sp.]|uniref:tyrosine-protein phosphatase n=1 Tax=Microbacterium sp. TaxID=51671 RepID=UPI0028121009|nr:tyrosine-protein phosphatase [Microbacterium sp.]